MWRLSRYAVTSLSILLCLATAVLWLRATYLYPFVGNVLLHPRGTGSARVAGLVGMTAGPQVIEWYVETQHGPAMMDVAPQFGPNHSMLAIFDHQMHWNGMSGAQFYSAERWTLTLPYWLILILVSAPLWLRVIRRIRAAPHAGHCAVCGYDLRASPQRCPECGTVVFAKVGAQ